jgi:hypothetical protein
MQKLVLSTALAVFVGVSANAQQVHVPARSYATDVWGGLYKPDHTITFAGRVTGIEKIKPAGTNDTEVTILVKKSDGAGTFAVDLGPSWYVDHQVATIKAGDHVQVTGSKAMVDKRGIIISSQIVVNGKGGLVLALRRPNGRAYWVGTEVAQNQQIPSGPNVVQGTITGFQGYSLNNIDYQSAMIQTANGTQLVDLGPTWYYGNQNLNYQIGDGVNVVVGPNPINIGPNMTVMPTYSIYNGPNVYTLRYGNGTPVFNWGPNRVFGGN